MRTYAKAMRTLSALLLAFALAACNETAVEQEITVEEAVVSLPAVPGRPGAAYFTLRTSSEPVRLVGISSPKIGRIELHETIDDNGMSRMVTIEDPLVSPGEPMTFEPGARHAMLFDLDPGLRPGGTVALTFSFDQAPAVTVEADLRGPGAVGHEGH